ncbi:autoinducer binding domain-containing protein [Bradyrhizobium cenepequi]|uniref:autoinducer binding domain-containing protein n=1 Tax=Bradyrhizobium cenepequi TaxID=2821403 RepID=UPI001CE2B00C|nr:autoinducer binding domain-containing protein [Bradyrhizobium cenepequi]MCA6110815.1 autoinducer binding domain-containing protein [Bradyrhizobium cenepequi]
MSRPEHLFQEFIDALQTARDDREFERLATRSAHGLGFRWFAYLSMTEDAPKLISSYPRSWTDRYFRLNYQRLDPVIHRARHEHSLFGWTTEGSIRPRSSEQRRFFVEATTFGIKSGITMPIRGGFGRTAAFTLATDDPIMQLDRLLASSGDILQLIGLYFHTHVSKPPVATADAGSGEAILSQRERQCLSWAARGKTSAETAVLVGVTPRTIAFHLENARRKVGAVSIAHCVALALRRGLLR